jgi:hypothetical protein
MNKVNNVCFFFNSVVYLQSNKQINKAFNSNLTPTNIMKNTMLASFPSFIADVLANVLRYRHDDVPVLVAQLVRDYPQFRADVVEEVVSMACDSSRNSNFRDNLALERNPDVMNIMQICMIKHSGNVGC